VIGVFVGLLLVGGALLALGPRLAAAGGASAMAPAISKRLGHAGTGFRSWFRNLRWRIDQFYHRIRGRGPDE
jgi:hypothetical protein